MKMGRLWPAQINFTMSNHTEELVQELPHLFSHWGLRLQAIHPELAIAGSPERSLHREVLEDTARMLFVLEEVPLAKRADREQQFRMQRQLLTGGVLGIVPWLPASDGASGVAHDGSFWQLRRWVTGEALDREHYGEDGWRGKAAATFLRQMACARPEPPPGRFLLAEYIQGLLPHIRQRIPALERDIMPILQALQPFFEVEPQLPAAFAHGDFHPGNILWGKDDINGIIDWEFNGLKTAGYDAANLLGCLGMDAPENLTAPFALEFIYTLRETGVIPEEAWKFLPLHIAALRFAWLREWVARKDKAMLCQELDFIWLIIDNAEMLRKRWS